MEVYVFFTLMGLGYMASQSSKKRSKQYKTHYTNSDDNNNDQTDMNMKSIYDNQFTKQVEQIERQAAKDMYDKSMTKPHPNVISKNYRDQQEDLLYESKLSGKSIPIEEFTHNNMEPFFGGTVKQNTNVDSAHETLLQNYTGVGGTYNNSKQENVCFADVKQNVGKDPYSKKGSYQEEYDRMVKSSIKNNELPFDKTYVGPGLDRGYDSIPSQMGFQPNDREFAKPKTIDELRVGSNPKLSYKGRTVDGQKGFKRGLQSTVVKNRVDTYYENTPDRYFKTTGAIKKDRYRPCHIIKDTNRKTSVPYSGNIYKNIGNEQSSKLQSTKKKILQEFGLRNAQNENIGKPEFDYGKQNILVYNNERDITATKTYEGNLTTIVKSIIAPVQDIFKTTNKEYTTFSNREFGELQANIPQKQTLYDPNDIARTTIKETFIHDTRTGNIIGDNKPVVYDPDDVMRKTLKETLPDYENVINMKGGTTKQTIYDPSDIAKTTIRETTENNNHEANIETLEGAGAYETTSVDAPNTSRQFLADVEYMGSAPSKEATHGYLNKEIQIDPTSKEFISNHERYGNANSADKKQMSYQDIYNATINDVKENLVKSREPTQNSVKLTSGTENIVMQSNKDDCERISSRKLNNIQKVYDQPMNTEFINLTQEKVEECEHKIDPSILTAFHDNPYTKPLNNAM